MIIIKDETSYPLSPSESGESACTYKYISFLKHDPYSDKDHCKDGGTCLLSYHLSQMDGHRFSSTDLSTASISLPLTTLSDSGSLLSSPPPLSPFHSLSTALSAPAWSGPPPHPLYKESESSVLGFPLSVALSFLFYCKFLSFNFKYFT